MLRRRQNRLIALQNNAIALITARMPALRNRHTTVNLRNLPFSFKVNRTGVMGGVAALLAVVTFLDYTGGTGSSGSSASRAQRSSAADTLTSASARAGGHASASQLWQEIRALSRLAENAPAVTRQYQSLAVPYAEMMAEVAVVHGPDEKPEAAAKRALAALLPPAVQIKALLVADGALAQQGNTLLTVKLSLESDDSQAMQQALLALGNPAAGMVWRELSLSADSEKRLVAIGGQLSVLAIQHAE